MHNSTVKILIVDDVPANLMAMEAALSGCGYELYSVSSGIEALDKVREHEFACILLDVQMPVMDGFETALKIRREPLSKTTPIIFATAIYRTEEHEETGYGAGAVDYLFKPINTAILKAKVSVFVELYKQAQEIKLKNHLLEQAILHEKENERLKIALSAKDEFIMMVSHELKTPITPLNLQMQTFIDLYESGAIQNIGHERILKMLKTSHAQVERLDRLIKELVDVSKISRDKFQIHKSETDLAEIILKVIEHHKEEIRESGCEVKFSGDSSVVGIWDPFRIEQVVVNLLINSLKYGAGRPVEFHVENHPQHAVFCIQDYGIGIAPVDQDRIFKRFERAVSSSNYSGLGLGLYISEQIVALHHGTITVDSAKGEGAKFVVELPKSV